MQQILIIALGVCGGLLLFANLETILGAARNIIKTTTAYAVALIAGFAALAAVIALLLSPTILTEYFHGQAAAEAAYQMTLKALGIALGIALVGGAVIVATAKVRGGIGWASRLRSDPEERALLLLRLRGLAGVLLFVVILAFLAHIVLHGA